MTLTGLTKPHPRVRRNAIDVSGSTQWTLWLRHSLRLARVRRFMVWLFDYILSFLNYIRLSMIGSGFRDNHWGQNEMVKYSHPIWAAIKHGNLEHVKIHVDAAALELRGDVGETPLHWCFLYYGLKQRQVAFWLLQHYPSCVESVYEGDMYEGENVLHMAIIHHDMEMVMKLVQIAPHLMDGKAVGSFFQPQNTCYYGETPLTFAACNNEREMVDFLVEKGADLTVEDSVGNSIFHLLVWHGLVEMYDHILSLWKESDGKPEKLVNNDKMTPLTLAAKLGKRKMFEYLLARDVHLEWHYGSVALFLCPLDEVDHISDNEDRPTAIEMLVQEGHAELLDLPRIYGVLSRKWDTSLRDIFFGRLLLTMICATVFTFTIIMDAAESLGPFIVSRLLSLGILALAIRKMYLSWLLIRHGGLLGFFMSKGSAFLGNTTRLIFGLCTVLGYLFRFLDPGGHTEQVLLSMAAMAVWLHLFSFLLAFRFTGPLILMIREILVKDIPPFLFLYSLFSIAFITAFQGLCGPIGFAGFSKWFESSVLIMAGQYPTFEGSSCEEGPRGVAALFLMVVNAVVMSVLMTNLLVAMMGSTYERVIRNADSQWLLEWARIMTSLQQELAETSLKPYWHEYEGERYIRSVERVLGTEEAWQTRNAFNPKLLSICQIRKDLEELSRVSPEPPSFQRMLSELEMLGRNASTMFLPAGGQLAIFRPHRSLSLVSATAFSPTSFSSSAGRTPSLIFGMGRSRTTIFSGDHSLSSSVGQFFPRTDSQFSSFSSAGYSGLRPMGSWHSGAPSRPRVHQPLQPQVRRPVQRNLSGDRSDDQHLMPIQIQPSPTVTHSPLRITRSVSGPTTVGTTTVGSPLVLRSRDPNGTPGAQWLVTVEDTTAESEEHLSASPVTCPERPTSDWDACQPGSSSQVSTPVRTGSLSPRRWTNESNTPLAGSPVNPNRILSSSAMVDDSSFSYSRLENYMLGGEQQSPLAWDRPETDQASISGPSARSPRAASPVLPASPGLTRDGQQYPKTVQNVIEAIFLATGNAQPPTPPAPPPPPAPPEPTSLSMDSLRPFSISSVTSEQLNVRPYLDHGRPSQGLTKKVSWSAQGSLMELSMPERRHSGSPRHVFNGRLLASLPTEGEPYDGGGLPQVSNGEPTEGEPYDRGGSLQASNGEPTEGEPYDGGGVPQVPNDESEVGDLELDTNVQQILTSPRQAGTTTGLTSPTVFSRPAAWAALFHSVRQPSVAYSPRGASPEPARVESEAGSQRLPQHAPHSFRVQRRVHASPPPRKPRNP